MVCVKLQLPYKLWFLSVFWITSKSNQKYMLDVVKEVFSRSGRTKKRCREASWLLNTFILGKNMSLYMVSEALILQEVHKMIKYGIAGQTKSAKKITLPPHIAKEPCVFSEIKSSTFNLCGFTLIYAEIESNSMEDRFLWQWPSAHVYVLVSCFSFPLWQYP